MRALTVALFALAAGCGYTSQYVAPVDGRARPVWHEDHVAFEPAGAPLSPPCMQWVGALSQTSRLHLTTGELRLTPPPAPLPVGVVVVAATFWAPRYFGPPIVAPGLGVAPLLPVPPLFVPPFVLHPAPPAPLVPGGYGNAQGPNLGDSRALEVLAAIALVVLPAVAVGLAASRPEDTDANAEAIDQVNAYNDLARSPGSACFVQGPPS